MTRYLSAEDRSHDDFGMPFTNQRGEAVYDAATRMGPWATMTEANFKKYGRGMGNGIGQKYVRDHLGHLNKVEG